MTIRNKAENNSVQSYIEDLGRFLRTSNNKIINVQLFIFWIYFVYFFFAN